MMMSFVDHAFASSMFLGGIAGMRATIQRGFAVKTPYEVAVQSPDPAALAARPQVANGATLYRLVESGQSSIETAQYWALEHPSTPGYANKYGLPSIKPDGIQVGKLKAGRDFVTREARPMPPNEGGGIEVVTNVGDVEFTVVPYP